MSWFFLKYFIQPSEFTVATASQTIFEDRLGCYRDPGLRGGKTVTFGRKDGSLQAHVVPIANAGDTSEYFVPASKIYLQFESVHVKNKDIRGKRLLSDLSIDFQDKLLKSERLEKDKMIRVFPETQTSKDGKCEFLMSIDKALPAFF